jgi:acyl-CoA thioester hydrolase
VVAGEVKFDDIAWFATTGGLIIISRNPACANRIMLKHTRAFRLRFYECDAYGHLNNTTYLRFMQEAAFDASAAAGYDMARYDALGHYWLIRETEIEYLQPLRYGDSVDVTTWIEDFRRVRSRRIYEFRHAGSSALVARAASDWVYINRATGKPATIPRELIGAFFPEGAPDMAPARPKFPDAPSPPPGIFVVHRFRRSCEQCGLSRVCRRCRGSDRSGARLADDAHDASRLRNHCAAASDRVS